MPNSTASRVVSNGKKNNLLSREQVEFNLKARDIQADWTSHAAIELEVFRKALLEEPDEIGSGIEKLQSLSDFAPIHQKVTERVDVIREGFSYTLSRWPLLFLISSFIFWEFLIYFVVRQIVNLIEYFSWSGRRGGLRLALRQAGNYKEWKQRALELDAHLGYTAWKNTDKNSYYDHSLIKRVSRSLKSFREDKDYEGVKTILEVALRSNFAGTESYHLYSNTFFGTKRLVEDHLDELVLCIKFVKEAPVSAIALEEKSKLLRSFAKNFGTSALALSGGASFAYYHFGVIRALLDEDLLPRIITGTSAGALCSAFLCTRTNEELKVLLTPELATRITACEEGIRIWGKRVLKTGARFDTIEWAKKAMFFTLGSLTFQEAYERTGRVLNVSVIPFDTHSPTKLLNYLNSPNCIIYTAVIASAAVPGILNPVILMKKINGICSPMEFQGKLKDGSLRADIPLESLYLLYNTNFSIVSQVNPHIHLFHFASRGAPGRPVTHRMGKGWRGGYLLASIEKFLKLELTKNFRVLRDLELLPQFAGQDWSAVFLQRFDGTVTIWPKSRVLDWFRILSDPDEKEMTRILRVGSQATWPKIHMIENRLKIEREIETGREAAYQSLLQSGSGNSALLRRESSYDLSSRISGTTIDSDSDTSNQGREGQEEEEEEDDGRTTPTAHRRKQILAKLGLNSKVSFSSRNEEITSVRSRSQSESNITRRISRARSGNGTRKGLGFIGSDSSLGVGDNWSSEEDEGRVLF